MTPKARRVLELLERGGWWWGVDLMEQSIGWAFSTRLSEVRQAGYPVIKRRCRKPEHGHRAGVYEYSLAVTELVSS
jgi:hypothetical protein